MGNVVLFGLLDPLLPRTPVQISCCNALGVGVGGGFLGGWDWFDLAGSGHLSKKVALKVVCHLLF
jgi:hypothetical protein